MKCAVCKTELKPNHFVVDIEDHSTHEYRVLHCCGRCAWTMAGLRRGTRFHMVWHVQETPEPVATMPLKAIENAQVNGLL